MKKIVLTLTIALFTLSMNAQTQRATLDYNNTRVEILNGGDFFWDLASSKYEVPKATGGATAKSTIFCGALWLGGEDKDGNVKLAAMTYRQRGQDFWPGPHSNDSNATRSKYDKIYKVSKAEITAHRANSSNPIAAILDWPGNGDTTKGEPYQLAPFVDINTNGKYEPALGDYPLIKGSGAAYCIYSDQGVHTESGGKALGVDVHQLFYQDVAAGFREVNLASFTVINRGTSDIHSFIFGVFTDFDLGNFSDDYVGTDTLRNMVYAYNGDSNDEGVLGYGPTPPSQSMMFLNQVIGSSMSYQNNLNPINGNPETVEHFYNYLKGNFKNSSSASPSNFAYPGDPITDSTFSETSAPADRRILGSTKPITLKPNTPICYDIAYVYGRAISGNHLNSITTMREKAAEVQSAYNANTYGWKTKDCNLGAQKEDETASIFPRALEANFSVYPNPSTGRFTIKDLKTNNPSVITTITGKIVKEVEVNTTSFDISDLESGVYFLKTEVGSIRLLKL